MCFFVQTNHTRKELLFLMFSEINLRNHSSLHKLFYGLFFITLYNIKNAFVLETFVSFLAKSDTILNNLTYFIKNLEREKNEKAY